MRCGEKQAHLPRVANHFTGVDVRSKILSILFLLVLGVGGFDARHVVEAQTQPRLIEITAHRFAFEPSEVTLKKGEAVVLVVTSRDVSHGLRFRELNQELKIPAGGKTQLRLTPDKVGDFVGQCSVFCGSGHGGMALTLHVVN